MNTLHVPPADSVIRRAAEAASTPWMLTTLCGRADMPHDEVFTVAGNWGGNSWNHGDSPWNARSFATAAQAEAFAATLPTVTCKACGRETGIRVTPCLCHECTTRQEAMGVTRA